MLKKLFKKKTDELPREIVDRLTYLVTYRSMDKTKIESNKLEKVSFKDICKAIIKDEDDTKINVFSLRLVSEKTKRKIARLINKDLKKNNPKVKIKKPETLEESDESIEIKAVASAILQSPINPETVKIENFLKNKDK